MGGGEDYITRSLMICGSRQILFGEQIENNESGGARSMHGGQKRCIQGFGEET